MNRFQILALPFVLTVLTCIPSATVSSSNPSVSIVELAQRAEEISLSEELRRPLTSIDRIFQSISLGMAEELERSTCTFETLDARGRPTPHDIYVCAGKRAARAGIPDCFPKIAIRYESGGDTLAINHDENHPDDNEGVYATARKRFLASGHFFSGAKFDPLDEIACLEDPEGCVEEMRAHPQLNDDILDLSREDLGVDLNRFNHGFGVGQITTSSRSFCHPTKPSVRIGDRCWFIKDILRDPQTNVEAVVAHFIMNGADKAYAKTKAGALDVWGKYIGGQNALAHSRAYVTLRCLAAADTTAFVEALDAPY